MTPRRKLMLWITGVLASVVVLGPAFYYTQVVRPVRAFEELCLSEVKVDPQRIRDAAHRALRWQIHHDAFVSLIDVADESSIPVLMRSLRRVPPPNENGLMICTTAHCFAALRKASGQNMRNSVEAWEDWYRKHKKQGSPPLTFKPGGEGRLVFDFLDETAAITRDIGEGLILCIDKRQYARPTQSGWDVQVFRKSDTQREDDLLSHSKEWHGPYPSQIDAWQIESMYFGNTRELEVQGDNLAVKIEIIDPVTRGHGSDSEFVSGRIVVTWGPRVDARGGP